MDSPATNGHGRAGDSASWLSSGGPNPLTSPDVPTKLWQLIPYNLMALGLISLWAILLFAGIPTARDDGEATSTASSLPPPLRRSW